jgi:formate-dependent phosphoribosylglycinamide formyltransferase (GAR transformylase)
MSHTARILLLGSGELGREFAISAKRLGAYVIACDSYDWRRKASPSCPLRAPRS